MKAVKVDTDLLNAARHVLADKLRDRLAPTVKPGIGVGGFADQDFVNAHGVGLHRLSETQLCSLALVCLIEHVEAAPPGKSGLRYFDD